jgi:adenosylhomocysteine nucleosidase
MHDAPMATDLKPKMLIVMALPQESDGLIEKVIEKNGNQAVLIYTGVGLISAAQKTTEAILKFQPVSVLNLGTAGSRKFSISQLIECTEFIYRGETSYMIKNKHKVDPLTNLSRAICASADHVDMNENALKYEVMDMEAYAIAKVCEEYNVRFNSIKYVTDSSDETMLQDWKVNLKHGATALQKFLHDFFQTTTASH